MERKTIEKIEETKEHTLVIEGRNAVLELPNHPVI